MIVSDQLEGRGSSRDLVFIFLGVARSLTPCDLSSAIHLIIFSAALHEPSQVIVCISGLNRAAATAQLPAF